MITRDAISRNFPSLEGRCYLNTAAESIPPAQVGVALREYWEHKLLGMDGRDAHFAREARCRGRAARLLGLTAEEMGLCSCSSEAYNLLHTAIDWRDGDEVVVNDLDFPAGATPWLAASSPIQVRLWKSRDGALDLSDLASLLTPRTRLVQTSLVSFYNGWRLPWGAFRDLVRAQAPQAVLAVDITQAFGRCVLDCTDADILISSTHKWLLGTHGSCVVGVPSGGAERLTARVGGWYHIRNAFDADRFDHTDLKQGAASYSVGMPSFAPIYALDAALEFLDSVGIEAIARHADPLVAEARAGLIERGLRPMAPADEAFPSGIIAFRHPQAAELHAHLHQSNIHIMHHAGRLRLSIHGYNTRDDVRIFLKGLDAHQAA